MENTVNSLRIEFSPESLVVLNFLLAFVMFGIALEVRWQDFRNLVQNPKPVITGIVSQFFLLPALTFVVVSLIEPLPSVALGMILVAACPGGNISNFISHLSGANAALSVSLTGMATVLSLFFTPFNLQLWAGLYEPTSHILQNIELSPQQIFKTVALILIIPLAAGMAVQFRFTKVANKIAPFFKILSVLIFMGFVLVAFIKNVEVFTTYIHVVFFLVLLHNALAFITGYLTGKAAQLSQRDRRTISIETGIQNSGLALLLIFSYFEGIGGMALTAAWWGVWHLVSGLVLAYFWKRVYKLSPALS